MPFVFSSPASGHSDGKAGRGVQLGSSRVQLGPVDLATNYGLLGAPNRLLRYSHMQHLVLSCTRAPTKRPRTTTPSGQLQTTSQQDA